ncbi:MAG TPA: AraC family transcriptional regulator [Streptosporangiaceae bacterium]
MTSTDRFASILGVVEDSLDEPDFSGEDLAARAYLSRYHFDRLAAAALGEPPGAFRRRLLLERAAHRLTSTADPVIEVALGAGYGSPEAFTRAFGRAYGSAPSAYRRRVSGPLTGMGRWPHDLPATSGVHFQPPGSLRLPAPERRTVMDVLDRMLDHHLWLVGEIVDRTAQVGTDVLDRPIELSVEGIDANPTLRSVTDRLVSQLEMWISTLQGGTAMPATGDTTPQGWRSRLAAAGPRFRDLVLTPVREGRADDTFIDAMCDPPQTFTYGGVLAHVLNFSAVRRTMAIGALDSAGVTDLGSGDPMRFVGGTGTDASQVKRNRD